MGANIGEGGIRGWKHRHEGGYGEKNHYAPKSVFMKSMKFIYLK